MLHGDVVRLVDIDEVTIQTALWSRAQSPPARFKSQQQESDSDQWSRVVHD